jgi:hypothetical protein
VVSLDTGKRKLLGMDWTGISVVSRASVDLLAKRKIPAPALKKVIIFNQQLVT